MTEEEKKSYLRRRNGVLEVLESLSGSWDLADGLIALIGSEFVTLEAIDGVENLLRESIKSAGDMRLQKKLTEGANKIHELRQSELMEMNQERNQAEEMVLKNFI
ncbi:MAG: hypothetical protein HHAS10_02700 [Candidatus Altimarinota bacterium]